MDVHSKEIRSYNMSKIKRANTKPEVIVRKYLFSKGFRYRKNVKTLPGCPDIVLTKYKTVIFVNGCFWHIHEGCRYFRWPENNEDFWRRKLLLNVERDRRNHKNLTSMGWKVIVVWECELRKVADVRLKILCDEIMGKESTYEYLVAEEPSIYSDQ